MIDGIPNNEMPREKLLNNGANTLSLPELLAILMRTGNREKNVIRFCEDFLKDHAYNLSYISSLSPLELSKYKGIGLAKATTIIAALELGFRRLKEENRNNTKILVSKDAFEYMRSSLSDKTQEEFWIILLNRSNKAIGKENISRGGLASTLVDPKVIFNKALLYKASSIILAHNHPSGDIEPSPMDIKLTESLMKGAKILEIKILDHIIIAENEYFSFKDSKVLF